ncbi:MAG TPA: alpha/beta hydrolase [Gaiellaceae bacterium]|nr:alpha/beta hydrolase [Gaiellaceae bacterium]
MSSTAHSFQTTRTYGIFICTGLDYDPRPALERITVPVLALFGSDDPIVPVAESVEVYRAAVPADLVRIEVFPGGDHRLQVGEPPRLADGYLETVSSFVFSAVGRN